ncbi:MAG: 16S rRNA (adenine(1518)-N(6)/adenine(1519)-N(6))-dimethyltransferase RsmA [Holosporales bacterium]|nr:16S rRNA (adenine(1518)-N(6)/adenine(1519)-N(6))-dimethyltransferase RsmA [Holosporales bacterium]
MPKLYEKINALPSISSIIKEFGLLQNKRHSKALGQNFLLDQNILNKIVQAAGDLSESVVIEVGAGPGGLTREILKQNPKKLIAIEKDPMCINVLQPLLTASNGVLEILEKDVLFLNFCEICQNFLKNSEKIKIIANLPYNIGTKIFTNFLYDLDNIELMVLMFQKEVADRILAKPETKDYGKLSVLAQYLTKCQKIMTLPPKAFMPSPKVSSCLLRFSPNKTANKALIPNLSKITNIVFQKRRKMLRNSLNELFTFEETQKILKQLNTSDDRRPETLSVDNFVCLAELLKTYNIK